jgi:hypothetical protein
MIALVKDKARIWYSFPQDALASGGVGVRRQAARS